MQSGVKPKATDRRDFVVIPSDQVRVAPSDAEITDLLRAAARQRSESEVRAALEAKAGAVSVPAVDATFRATAASDDMPGRKSSFGRRAMRAFAAFLLAIGIGGAALTWQTFGYAAKKAMLSWAPKWAITASLPLEQLGLGTRPSTNDPAETTAPAAAAPAENAADTGTPDNATPNTAAAAPPSDSAQQVQSMARDLASANQEIETLKASIAELKASQQQMARDLAKANEKVAEQNARAKTAAAAPRPAVAPRKPAAAYSPTATYAPSPAPSSPSYRPTTSPYTAQASTAPPPPAAAQPYVPPPPIPLQPQADPGVTSVPRPPMPVQ